MEAILKISLHTGGGGGGGEGELYAVEQCINEQFSYSFCIYLMFEQNKRVKWNLLFLLIGILISLQKKCRIWQ